MKITASHIQAIEDFLNGSNILHITGQATPTMIRYLVRAERHVDTLEVVFYDNEGKHIPLFKWIIA